MEKLDIKEYLRENEIEERVPYFGKARLLTIPLSYFIKNKTYIIPKEIFHFMTALYLIDNNKNHEYYFIVNSYKKKIDSSLFSEISPECNKRINILKDPILMGMNTNFRIEICFEKEIEEESIVNLLIEYAKISPDLYQNLHTNNIVLVSHQDNVEIHQFRGNTP